MPSRGSWTPILGSTGPADRAVALEPASAGASFEPARDLPPEPPADSGAGRSHPPFARDVIWTTATTALIGVAVILLNADLARRGAAQVFGPVNYAKRAAGTVVPLLSLCTTVGVVRYVAAAASETERRLARCGTIWMVLVIMALGTGVVALFGPWLARVSALEPLGLLWAMWAYSVAMVLNGISYALRRADLRQGAANWIYLWANALVPVLVIVLAPRSWSGATLLLWMSVPVAVWHAGELAVISIRNALAVDAWSGFVGLTRRLTMYSAARVPGSVASSAMSVVGPWMAARGAVAGTEALSGLLAAFAVVSIANYSLQAVGMVVLPRAAAMSAGRTRDLHVMATRLLVASVVLSAVSVPPALVLARDACVAWFGPAFVGAVPLVRIVLISVPAVLVQVLLRSVIDGAIERAWNTYAMIAGLVVCLIGSLVFRDAPGLAWAFTAGTWVTGILTVAVVRIRFGTRVGLDAWLLSLAFAAITALASFAALVLVPGAITRLAVAAVVAAGCLAIPFVKGTPVYRMLWAPRERVPRDSR